MPKILTTKASILCPHGGVGTSIPSDPKWSINGGTVLLENDTGTLSCIFIPPCVGYQLKSMGLNATVVDGRKVILDTDFNQTQTQLPLKITEFHQTIDNSTPAPIPTGQAAGPLPPELADTVEPVVVVVPPALAFSLTTLQPATVVATFTLFSAHPLQWVLIWLNKPGQNHLDLTNGSPPGSMVIPTGGAWDTPNLTVTLTLTSLFMATLPPGEHEFIMTAVNRRGLFNSVPIVLTVSA